MPKYVLHYFQARARGELIRLALTLAGQDFTDHAFAEDDWESIKADMPAGQVPVLEVDGKKLNESIAIAKYIANEYGFAGKTNLEQYYVDRIISTIMTLLDIALDIFYYEQDESKKAEKQVETFSVKLPRFLDILTRYFEESSDDSNFFVGKTITLADLAVHDVLTTFILVQSNVLDHHPKLQANRKAVETHPRLSEYISTRKVQDI